MAPRTTQQPPRFIALALTIMLVALLHGCGTMSVDHRGAPGAKLKDLKTYAWLPNPGSVPADPRLEKDRVPLAARVRRTVDSALSSKGYRLDEENPDFLVGYHVTLGEKVNVTTINRYYGYGSSADWSTARTAGYRGYGSSELKRPETYVYEYEEGTLILDMVTPGERSLLWRGSARDEVNLANDLGARQRHLEEAVDAILAGFPDATGGR